MKKYYSNMTKVENLFDQIFDILFWKSVILNFKLLNRALTKSDKRIFFLILISSNVNICSKCGEYISPCKIHF